VATFVASHVAQSSQCAGSTRENCGFWAFSEGEQDWGGPGSLPQGAFETLAAINIVKTNNLPQTNQSADGNVLAKYRGDYSNTMGLIMNRMAVGMVPLMDISLETAREIRTQGTFMVGKVARGHRSVMRKNEGQLSTGLASSNIRTHARRTERWRGRSARSKRAMRCA
jgi:hypothetical protein